MKNKLLALLATIGLVSSASAVEINENLSISGFIDGSYQKGDGGADDSLGIDEVEVDLSLNVGSVAGEIHIDQTGAEAVNIEQAFFTYSLENGVSVTLGSYGSALGLEGADPTSLYTFSRAYNDTYNFADVDSLGAVQGVTVAYAGGDYSIAASFESDGTFGNNSEDLDVEFAFSYTGLDNVVLGLGYFMDNSDNDAVTAGEQSRNVVAVNATYSMGTTLLGAEYIAADDDDPLGGESAFMLLLDHDFNDKLGAALRYSEYEQDSAAETQKFTIAPNYAITDSLGAIIEYSNEDDGANDTDTVAVELLYTF